MPTTSRSSPTTTSAVNEKRRPPLTTLATRLISTTRSCRSSPAAETVRSRTAAIGGQVSEVIGVVAAAPNGGASERQPALTGSVGERLNAPVILVATAVEHRAVHAGGLGPLREQRARARRLLHLAQAAQVSLDPTDRGQRAPGVVVDQLGEDAAVRAEHRDP